MIARRYCVDLVTRADEDLAISLGYAPAEDRARLASLFALVVELRRIPSLVSEPPLGEIRLQWWREALDEIAAERARRAHPVVEALATAGSVTSDARAIMDRMIELRARLLYDRTFSTLRDLEDFLRGAEAPIVALAARGNTGLDAQTSSALGEAYALARFAPILAPGLAESAAKKGLDRYLDHAPALNALPPAAAGRIAFLALTRGHAARADGRPWPVAKRLALFRAILSGRF